MKNKCPLQHCLLIKYLKPDMCNFTNQDHCI